MNCAGPSRPPTSRAGGALDVAAVHDLERVEQLAAEERRAARIPGERRERGDVGRTPLKRPKFDSMPQIATMIFGGTP